MGKCTVINCNSNTASNKKRDGITYHSIPKDPFRQQKWIEIIRLLRKETDWLPTKHTIVCSNHFREQDKIRYKKNSGRLFLANEAIPMLEESNTEEQAKQQVGGNQNTDVIVGCMDVNYETGKKANKPQTPRKPKMRKQLSG